MYIFIVLVMISLFMYITGLKKEILVGVSLPILYITYYLMEVVKKPVLICREGEFRQFLEENVPLLKEYYWPTPWCVESHLQTVLGSILRSYLLPTVHYHREVLKLSDGGQVALDWAEWGGGETEDRPVLLVLPGLTGGSHADYVRSLAAAAAALGAHACVFHNRGLGGLPLTSPRLYSAVSHGDLAEVAAAVGRARRGPLLAAGVSLGGLILGQYLAAAGARSRVRAALLVSAPLDVERGAACMERGGAALLSRHMARALRRTLARHRMPAPPARSVRQFDAAFTARHFGFPSVEAYYRAASLRDKLGAVRVPTLCLQAADDPFQPWSVLPAAEAAASARVALAVTARGGHIGFLEGAWPAAAPRDQYIARLAAQYFGALLRRKDLLHAAPSTHAARLPHVDE